MSDNRDVPPTADYGRRPEVLFEVRSSAGWTRVGSVSDVEPPGSFSSLEPTGRQVYMFGWYDERPGVWRSHGGVDSENPAVRAITTTGFDQLADLAAGPHEMDVWLAAGRRRVRFTLSPNDGSAPAAGGTSHGRRDGSQPSNESTTERSTRARSAPSSNDGSGT
jgi:hypothetical protein